MADARRVVLASRNAHKIAELRRMAPGIEWIPLPPELGDPPETGDTFSSNAAQKARFAFDHTGEWSLADDSGLEVDALGGRPGVWSKRYSDAATDTSNNKKLIAELGDTPRRSARYRCVIVLVGEGVSLEVSGACEGTIGFGPRGAGGFGYDPLFLPTATPGRTMAELTPDEKDTISHRGAAMRRLMEVLGASRAPMG